jgi:hypothetical protein
MNLPKLKPGQGFHFNRRMAEDKIETKYNDPCEELVGKYCTVESVTKDGQGEYGYKLVGSSGYFLSKVIDKNLIQPFTLCSEEIKIDEIKPKLWTVKVLDLDGVGGCDFDTVDAFLPKTKPVGRTWETSFKSSDGIEIKNGKITLSVKDDDTDFKFTFSLEQLNALANQIRAAKLQLKKLK